MITDNYQEVKDKEDKEEDDDDYEIGYKVF